MKETHMKETHGDVCENERTMMIENAHDDDGMWEQKYRIINQENNTNRKEKQNNNLEHNHNTHIQYQWLCDFLFWMIV